MPFQKLLLGLCLALPLTLVSFHRNILAEANEPALKAEAELKRLAFTQHLETLYHQMGLQKWELEANVFEKAVVGYYNLKAAGKTSDRPVLTIVDFSKSSRQKRLWVLDLVKRKVLFHTLVAHGRNSGEEFARHFSNENQSYKSSLGFYVTLQPYQGKHGLSLKLDGLDKAFNINALARAVVMHGADYVSDSFVRQHGRLGAARAVLRCR